MAVFLKNKIIRTLVGVFTAFVVYPVFLYAMFQWSFIQTKLAKVASDYLSDILQTRVSVGFVSFAFFNDLVLKEVYIQDESLDTLAYIGYLRVNTSDLNFDKNIYKINKLYLNYPKIYLKADSAGTFNYQFILTKLGFSNSDTSATDSMPAQLEIANLRITNATMLYQVSDSIVNPELVNFNNLYFSRFNTWISNFQLINDSIKLNIDSLRFYEKSGWNVTNLTAGAFLYNGNVQLNQLSYASPWSAVYFSYFAFKADGWKAYSNFISDVFMNIAFAPGSKFSFKDLQFFTTEIKPIYQTFNVYGNVAGTINNIKIRNFEVSYGANTQLITQIDAIGLPDINNTYFDVKIQRLSSSEADINSLHYENDSSKLLISVPKELENFGVFNYSGRITGLSKNFVADGTLTSNLGLINTDVKISEDTVKHKINVVGIIAAQGLDLAALTGNSKNFGKLAIYDTININIFSGNRIEGTINGIIDSVGLFGYDYTNTKINGTFTEKTFDGLVTVNDKNLNAVFQGYLNFENEKPMFDFTLNVKKANLYKLKLEKDSGSYFSAGIRANFQGSTIDDINGSVFLTDKLIYKRGNKSLILNTFNVSSDVRSIIAGKEFKTISVYSDYFDAEISGILELSKIATSFENFLSNYIPASRLGQSQKKSNSNKSHLAHENESSEIGNNFKFVFNLRKTKTLTDFFMPSLSLSDNTVISGEFNSIHNFMELNASASLISFGGVNVHEFLISANTRDNIFTVNSSSSIFEFSPGYSIQNFVLETATQSDSTAVFLQWDNKKDSAVNKGIITAVASYLVNPVAGNFPIVDVNFNRDSLVINDSKWLVQKLRIIVDSNSIDVRNMFFQSVEQMISANGIISEKPTDELNIRFQNFDMESLNPLLGTLSISGRMSGGTKILKLYQTPVFSVNSLIRNLIVNKVPLGNMSIESEYIPSEERIFVDVFTQRTINESVTINEDTLKLVHVIGNYYPVSNKVDFSMDINWLPLNTFKPYFEEYMSTSRFTVLSGKGRLTGTTEKPVINSMIFLKGGFFNINYLGTKYDITDTLGIHVTNKLITINKSKLLSDKGAGVGYIHGNIRHNMFSDMKLNLELNSKNFQFLNTQRTDSSDFYGKAYATGDIKITGSPELLQIDIQAKTEKNTVIYLPLDVNQDVTDDNNFITFKSTDTLNVEQKQEYKVDLTGIAMNFNLDVTPDAEIQIIMDETVGDIIKAQGNGNLRMRINTVGDFLLFGTYTIEKGEYLFTLQNILSKKFEVTKGSTLKWNGDPMEAIVDIQAEYKLKKVNLYDLMLSDEFRDEKVPVSCYLNMTDYLMSPQIKFDLSLPDANERVVSQVKNLDEENLNKQVISLLVLNKFQPLPGFKPDQDFSGGSGTKFNTGELISNQLNHWLDDISNQVDFGINYQTGNQLTTDQVELALSTQLWDDRVSINGNVGVGGETKVANVNNSNSVVGDVEVEVKLTRKGNLKLKIYNKSNQELDYGTSPYKQGVGIFFRKDFNKFRIFGKPKTK